jgi:hypothetical protein
MEITVKVDTTGIDLTTVIGERSRYDHDIEEGVSEDVTLGDEVAKRITAKLTKDEEYPGLRKRFLAIRDEEIRKALEPVIVAAISGPIQKTNNYGEPSGGTTTLRELIMDEAQRLATAKVSDGYRSSSETVLAKFVREQIAAAFTKELAAVVAEEKAKVVAAVRAKAADLIAEAVKQGVGR